MATGMVCNQWRYLANINCVDASTIYLLMFLKQSSNRQNTMTECFAYFLFKCLVKSYFNNSLCFWNMFQISTKTSFVTIVILLPNWHIAIITLWTRNIPSTTRNPKARKFLKHVHYNNQAIRLMNMFGAQTNIIFFGWATCVVSKKKWSLPDCTPIHG